MNHCTVCGQPAIFSRPLPISIIKTAHFCPRHFVGLTMGQVFTHNGMEQGKAIDTANTLMELVMFQERGLWSEEMAADVVGLGATLDAVRQAKTPKDITG